MYSQYNCRHVNKDDIEMLKFVLRYQFCSEAVKALDLINVDKLRICISKSTLRPRAILYNNKLFAMIRAFDFYMVPHIPLGILMHKVLPFPKRRVVVANEIVDDVINGSSVFAKHIIAADEALRPFEEVLVVDEDDKLISLGRTLLDYKSMITATYGVAVHIREKVEGKLYEEEL